MSFTTAELILLILIVLIVLIVFVMLVRNEIKEYLSSKNTKLVTEDDIEVNKKGKLLPFFSTHDNITWVVKNGKCKI